MEIRELTAADRQATIVLWEQAGLTRPWNRSDADFDRAVGGPTSAVLGAIDEDAHIATVMAGHDGHRGWVYYLEVRRFVPRTRSAKATLGHSRGYGNLGTWPAAGTPTQPTSRAAV